MISVLEPVPAYYFPYEMPVSATSFPHLCLLCSAIGLFFTGWFFSLLVMSSRATRSVLCLGKEVGTALLASLFLGLAAFFLCLMVGIYV